MPINNSLRQTTYISKLLTSIPIALKFSVRGKRKIEFSLVENFNLINRKLEGTRNLSSNFRRLVTNRHRPVPGRI